MGANIWFWLIYVLVGVFGIFGMNPWRPDQLSVGTVRIVADFVYPGRHSWYLGVRLPYTLIGATARCGPTGGTFESCRPSHHHLRSVGGVNPSKEKTLWLKNPK